MLSNSLPVRDFDFFASRFRKNLRIFHNRGASGIDGILSTALGIASVKNNPTFLITGDIAFYYDINALLAARKYAIPLVIILINNNGGGIFNVLPVSKYPRFLNEYFITPHNLHFGKLTKAFGIKYTKAKSWDNFIQLVVESFSGNEACVIEIKTDSPKSARSRKDYWSGCNKILNEFIVPPKTQQNN
jgi:2-succinyl-5-enolpyruvyl-6-hydroxy-3-cyclohexene-1-carboxylate synthase